MAGIAGLIGNIRREEGIERVGQMLQAMTHEPFYSKRLYVNEELGLYAGSLAHPNSFCDCMPVENEDRSISVLLHGEVFTSPDELDHLKRIGHRFSGSDASHLVHLYEELQEKFFDALNGTFCGVLADCRTKKVQIFNDRLGFERMYYCVEEGVFYFASEAKSLLRIIPRARQLEREALIQLLSYGCTLGETALYKGVFLMPPASVWECDRNAVVKKRTYFRPDDWPVDPTLQVESFQEAFKRTFQRIVPLYFRGNLRPGLSLTGGWDTRMILASCRRDPGALPCYTFAGMDGDTVDVQQAQKVALATGQEYSILRLESDFLEDFHVHAEKAIYISDGYGDVCLSHEAYLNRLARGNSGVRITGNFGSEVLRGMSTFKERDLKSDSLPSELLGDITAFKREFRMRAEPSGAKFAIFSEIPWTHSAIARLAGSQLPVRSPFLDSEVLKLASTCPPSVLRKCDLPTAVIRDGDPGLLRISTDRGEAGESSVVGRTVARAVLGATFKVDYLLREGAPDFLAGVLDRVQAQRLLPFRHKYLDYRRWFSGPLQGYVHSLLGDGNNFVNGIFGQALTKRVLRANEMGVRNELPLINLLTTLELIDKCLLRPV
jgi:asparagine synthase (glutamine-hydrolysing)